MFKNFFKKSQKTSVAGEEITEKKTTTLGKFLLFCMFVAILVSAQWTLEIINKIPKEPDTIPNCIKNILYKFEADDKENEKYSYNYGEYGRNDCDLSSENPKFNFEKEYGVLSGAYENLNNITEEISNLESKKYRLEKEKGNSREDYNTSLTEKIAGENSGLYDKNKIQEEIKNSKAEVEQIDKKLKDLETEKNKIISENKAKISELKAVYEKAQSDYEHSYLMYKLYISLLSFIFSISVFLVLYKLYVNKKSKNSPYTIIFSVATFAYGLMLLEVTLLFISYITPGTIKQLIYEFFVNFKPIMYLVQFLWPILIVSIFGFLIYKIQKRIYSKENILKRFVSDKKCPNCGNSVDTTKPFCPLCSHEILVKCHNCQNLTTKGMPYCSNCGKKLKREEN
ncbi:hypothetical protein BKN14_01340 [Candidatus Gracilibacteria bacterium HOT-871]|nr:hypothetical protein BKN14_01340 [Candidatus Gracilibacteria bacterium HOT-871]